MRKNWHENIVALQLWQLHTVHAGVELYASADCRIEWNKHILDYIYLYLFIFVLMTVLGTDTVNCRKTWMV